MAILGGLIGAFLGAYLYSMGGFLFPISFLALSFTISIILAYKYFDND